MNEESWNGCFTLLMAAVHLGIGEKRVRALLNQGKLSGYKRDRFWRSDDLVTWHSIEQYERQRRMNRNHGHPHLQFSADACQRCGILLPVDENGHCACCQYELQHGRVYPGVVVATLPACKHGRLNGR